MAEYRISPSKVHGTLAVPPSKSHTLRAILFAALASGKSQIDDFLPSPDAFAMIDAVSLLGAKVKVEGSRIEIEGGELQAPEDVIQCGNSGLVLRLIGALAGLMPHYTILTGDHSIRHNRLVKPLLDALTQLGAMAVSARGDGFAPILVKGPLVGRSATLDGRDSQPVSGLIIAGAFAPHGIDLRVENAGERPWIDLTLDWLRRLEIPYERQGYSRYRLEGNAKPKGFEYRVPGDFSTAAFPIAAALLTHSELTLSNIDMEDCQGDKAIIGTLEQMGARFEIDRRARTLKILQAGALQGMRIDANDFVDALPILAVIATIAEGTTEIVGASVARSKESDRIRAITAELKKMGADIEERADGVTVKTSKLKAATLETYHDHRLAMALSIAAMAAEGPSTIRGAEAAAKTYPDFAQDFQAIGARIDAGYTQTT